MWIIISLILAVLLAIAGVATFLMYRRYKEANKNAEEWALGNREIEESLQQEVLEAQQTMNEWRNVAHEWNAEYIKLRDQHTALEERHDKLGNELDIVRFIASQHADHCLPTTAEIQVKVLAAAKAGELDLSESWKAHVDDVDGDQSPDAETL